jgi:kinesin family protein 14
MLATINSSSTFLDETLCTLRYAAKTATIKNLACLNRDFKKKYVDEFGQECELNLILEPMLSTSLVQDNRRLEMTVRHMDEKWQERLREAERLKQKEIVELERSLLCLYESETRARSCCLVNLNEDPSLSEKLIYVVREGGEPVLVGSDKERANIHLSHVMIAPVHCQIVHVRSEASDR